MEKVEVLTGNENTYLVPVENEMVFTSEQGVPVTTSLKVAEVFGKRHDNVLRAIRKIIKYSTDNQAALHFVEWSERKELPQGGSYEQSYYTLTRDGFSIVAMGFTGEKAIKFKWDYIDAFNKMENILKEIQAKERNTLLEDNTKLLKDNEEQKKQLEMKNKELEKQGKEIEKFVEEDGLWTTTAIASMYPDMTAEKLHGILQMAGIIKYSTGDGCYVLTKEYSNPARVKCPNYIRYSKEFAKLVKNPVRIGRKTVMKFTLKWTNEGRRLINDTLIKLKYIQKQLDLWNTGS